MGVMLFPLGMTSAVASATPTVLNATGAALLAHAVAGDPHSGQVFQADPTTSTVRVFTRTVGGGYRQTQSVPVGAGPVSTVYDPTSGHVLTADQRAGTVTTLARGSDGSWRALGSTSVGFAPAVVAVERGSGIVHAASAPGPTAPGRAPP